MRQLFLGICLLFFCTSAQAKSLKCVDRVPPVGGIDRLGKASYLDFEPLSAGNYRLQYATGCTYVETEEKCRNRKQITRELEDCEIREFGARTVWTCSTKDYPLCFFADYMPNEPEEYFLKGKFNFEVMHSCWLQEWRRGEEAPTSGLLSGCEVHGNNSKDE